MSLEALMRMRRQRVAPSVVWVVVGRCPDRLKDQPDCVAVTAKPLAMDWRPVLGLHVDVFDLSSNRILLADTLDALESAQPRCIGVACTDEVIGLSPEHEFSLRSIWRHLARTH